MTKEIFALHVPDVSAFARSLVRALAERAATKTDPPGQTEVLNLIARAQGQRNWQALRVNLQAAPAARAAPAAAEVEPAAAALALGDNARKALNQFDRQGRLMRWPVKYAVQTFAMWALWTRFEAKRAYTESEVNAILKSAHLFFDHATLRRELINHRLLARKPDCSEYRKLPARADAETRAFLTAWRAKRRAALSGPST